MRLQLCKFTKETFTSSVGIVLPDGKTILRTKTDLVWAGREVRDAEIAAFKEFIDVLEIMGCEIVGKEILDKLT